MDASISGQSSITYANCDLLSNPLVEVTRCTGASASPTIWIARSNSWSGWHRSKAERGLTLLELVVAATILSILTLMALPLARVTIKREKEKRLRQALWEMRDAIDKYKDAADRGAFQIKADSQGYPPDLDTLVKGVDIGGKKTRFLRRIPVDPMTGTTEWVDLLPAFRTSPSMISDEGKGKGYVEEQAHGSGDDRGLEAAGSGS